MNADVSVGGPARELTLAANLGLTLGNLEIVSFQILYQTKLLQTALLSVCCLRRQLRGLQWLALLLLTLGVAAVELSEGKPAKKQRLSLDERMRRQPKGKAARPVGSAAAVSEFAFG